MKKLFSFLFGSLIGGGIAFVTARLLAPDSGEVTQAKVKEALAEPAYQVLDQVDRSLESVQKELRK